MLLVNRYEGTGFLERCYRTQSRTCIQGCSTADSLVCNSGAIGMSHWNPSSLDWSSSLILLNLRYWRGRIRRCRNYYLINWIRAAGARISCCKLLLLLGVCLLICRLWKRSGTGTFTLCALPHDGRLSWLLLPRWRVTLDLVIVVRTDVGWCRWCLNHLLYLIRRGSTTTAAESGICLRNTYNSTCKVDSWSHYKSTVAITWIYLVLAIKTELRVCLIITYFIVKYA